MSSVDWFVLRLNPEPWAVGPAGVARRNGALVPYIGPNRQLQSYQEAVAEEMRTYKPCKIEGRVKVTFYFWRNSDHRDNKHDADLTNLQKGTEDALQGVLFDNDRLVHSITSVLVEQGPEVEGLAAVRVESIPEGPMALPFGLLERLSQMNEEEEPDQQLALPFDVDAIF